MDFNELIRSISFNTFSEVIETSPRKVRESLYSHYGIKSKSSNMLISIKEKKERKFKQLHSALQNANDEKEQTFLKELFRNWLFRKRPMLKETLDFLGEPNDNGLIEKEPDFFKNLSEEQISSLINHLKPKFSADEILVYLTFMEVPNVRKHL